ncbi:MAG: hypothetical protein GXO50_05345 [Chlorobi bacterium]|nr:hypothetical protein [Chlorobiota bacterium]
MKKNIFITGIIIISVIFISGNKTLINKNEFKYKINDSAEITIKENFSEKTQIPCYYSNMIIPACNTGECKLIHITIYWDAFGNYLKYAVPSKTPLTKYNHKKFKKSEYVKLHKILNDPKSKYKNFTIDKLTEKQAQNKYKTDGNTGATLKLFYDAERIKGAVKTTHTLWHVVNGNINEILKNKTKKQHPELLAKTNIFDTKPDKQTLKKLENKISENNPDSSILICNYFLKNNIKSGKANKFLKQFNFIQKQK